MSCTICRKCRENNLDLCSLGYDKTNEQLVKEKYSCFKERIHYIDMNLYHPDLEVNPYKDEITNYDSMRLHADMRKSERQLKKT